MGRERRSKGHDTSRDGGPFLALPWQVLDCPGYLGLSHPAKALLIDIARQYVRDNNGRLLASRAHMSKRGWTSSDTVNRALKELMAAKLIHQTVMGHRPNKASWYAVTWRTLDKLQGYDAGAAESFERGAYAKQPLKNAVLKPSGGVGLPHIAPSGGVESTSVAPSDGAMRGVFGTPPTPGDGHHLDKPSTVPELEAPQHTGNYRRLNCKRTGVDGWLPAGLVNREVVPVAVTRKAAKHLSKLPKGAHDAVAIQAGRAAGLSIDQLSEWAGPYTTARALAAGSRPWRDLWTHINLEART